MARPWLIRYMGRMDGTGSTYMQIFVQARSEDFKRGGRDFKCCCVQENFEKLTLSGAFSDHFLRKGGGARDRRPPPLTAYARGIGLVQVILVLSFFHFCLKLSFVKSNRIILTETHVHKIPPPLSKVRPIHKQLLLFVSPGIQT